MKKSILLTVFGLILALTSFYSFQDPNEKFTKYHQLNVGAAPLFSVDPPPGKTGAPFEGNCTDCHGGIVNPAEGTISLTGLGEAGAYNPGETYNANISSGVGAKNGFTLIIVDESENSVGTFDAGTGTNVINMVPRDYIGHTDKFNTGWDFDWTAPAEDMGDLMVYYCYRILYTGDDFEGEIFVGQMELKSTFSSIKENDPTEDIKIWNDAASSIVHLDFKLPARDHILVHVQNINGQEVLRKDLGYLDAGSHNETFSFAENGSKRVHLIFIFIGNRIITRKVMI